MLHVGECWALSFEVARDLAARTQRLGSIPAAVAELVAASPSAASAAGPGVVRTETRGGAVAIVPIHGMILSRSSGYGTSAAGLARAVQGAAADAEVKAIVLDVFSPGGEVYGIEEAHGAILEARKAKPVVAVANPLAASAAYWLASASSEILVTPSGEAGSIGVYGMHADWSKALEDAGIRVTLVSAGKYKTEGNPYGPLSPEAAAAMQATVDGYYSAFVRNVARGRGVSVEDVRGGFGEGRVVGAARAVELGLANAAGTLDDAIRRASALAVAKRRAGESVAGAIAARVRLVD